MLGDSKFRNDIEIVMGLRGYGKSMYLTRYARQYMKKNKNCKVYSNFNIKGSYKCSVSDMTKYYFEECLLIIDEAQLDINSRDYKKFSKDLLELFSMSRHYDVTILVATQHVDSIDIAVRRLADRIVLMDKTKLSKWFCKYKVLKKMIYLSCDYDNKVQGGKAKFGTIEEGYYYYHKRKYILKNKWGKFYDTKDKRHAQKPTHVFELY